LVESFAFNIASVFTAAVVFGNSLFEVERIHFVFEALSVHWRTWAENELPFISAKAAIHIFSSGSNLIAEAVIAIMVSTRGIE
jgi:hypothetical protein